MGFSCGTQTNGYMKNIDGGAAVCPQYTDPTKSCPLISSNCHQCPDGIGKNGVLYPHSSSGTYFVCHGWDYPYPTEGTMQCYTRNKGDANWQRICTKSLITHVNQQSKKAGVLLVKRTFCTSSGCK